MAYGGCEVMKRQVEIQQIKVQNKISYVDAVKMVNITGERRMKGKCSCGSVVEHCVSSAKGCGFDSQGTHIVIKHV